MDRTSHRPEEELTVDDRGRCQRAIEEFLVLTGRPTDRLLPEDLIRAGIGGAHGVAVRGEEPPLRHEWLGALVGPDG